MTSKSTRSILSEKGAEAVETEEVHDATKKHSNDNDANSTTLEGDLTRSQRKQAALALAKSSDFLYADDDEGVSDPAVHHSSNHNSEENNEKQMSKDDNDDRMEKGLGKTPPPLRRSRDVSGPRSSSRPGAFAQPGIHSGSGHSGEDRSVSAGATAPQQQQQQQQHPDDDGDEEVPSQDILIMATLVEDPPPLASQITQATAVTLDESERIEDESGAASPSVRSVLKNHMVAEEKQDRRLLYRLVGVVGVLAVAGFVVLLVLLLKGDSGSSSDSSGNGSNNLASPPTSSSTEDAATNPAWFAQQDHVSFHAVQYRADIPTHCDSVAPAAELSLSCERESLSSSSTTRMPSVLVVNSGSANVLCERHNDNWISCRVASDVLDPEWILLAACGEAQDQGDNDDTVLTLRAGLSQRELTGCGDVTEETTAGTATTKVYASEAFQSLAVGQFCFDQDDDENGSGEEDDGMKFMMETNSCLQGHEQAMDNSNSLICVASSSCQSEWTCLENGSDCSGSSHCDYTLGPVEAKDPRMGCSSMMEAKDDNGNFDFDEAGMMEMAGNKMERRRTRWQRI